MRIESRTFPRSNRTSSRPRAGLTLLETVVTLALMGVLLSAIVPVTHWTNAQRRESDRRELAIQTAANLLERFSAREWEQITQSAANDVTLPPEAAAQLPEASLTIAVVAAESDLPSKRITVAIGWIGRAGGRVPPARLTGYVFPPGGTP